MRVCQFRHDGKWTSIAAGENTAASGRPAFLFYKHEGTCQITTFKKGLHPKQSRSSGGAQRRARSHPAPYPSALENWVRVQRSFSANSQIFPIMNRGNSANHSRLKSRGPGLPIGGLHLKAHLVANFAWGTASPLLLQLGIHRNLRVQHLRYRTSLLRCFGILLKCCRVGPRNFPHHVDVACCNRPS